MGNSTFVENNNLSAPPAASPGQKPRSQSLPVDLPLIAAVIALSIFGIIMVYSSSWFYSLSKFGTTGAVAVRQLQWLVVGTVLGACAYFFNYHYYRRLLIPMVVVTLLALVAVLAVGGNHYGTKRALFGSGSVQPSELAKLVVIIYLSFWLFNRREHLNNVMLGVIPLGLLLGIFGGLTLLQPDLSAAATIVVIGVILFYLADASPKQIAFLLVVCLIAGSIAVMAKTTGRTRMAEWWAGLYDRNNASPHVQESLDAISRGGLFGVGIGKGSSKVVRLPVAWTDSIFAVITEETGLIGALAVLFLYLVILWRGIKIAQEAPDQLGKLLAGGVTFWITWEAILNMGVLVNVFPFTGNALPMISQGGSSLIMVLIGVGILANVSRAKYVVKENLDGRSIGATVDLRRRDWRRRESHARRPASNR